MEIEKRIAKALGGNEVLPVDDINILGSGLNLGFAVNIHAKFNFVNKQANDSIMH